MDVPSKPYYMPKARCHPCDRKYHNAKKEAKKRAKKPITYCVGCGNPFPHGTHLSKRVCDICASVKQVNLRKKRFEARIESLRGHECMECHVPLNLDVEFQANPVSKGKPRTFCERCAHKRKNRSKSLKLRSTEMGSAFRQIKKRCRVKNLPFDLTLSDLVVPAECPVLKKPMIPVSIGGANPMMPSVDRHVPEKGYTKDNIVIMSHRANTIKGDSTFEEIEALYLYLKGKQSEK